METQLTEYKSDNGERHDILVLDNIQPMQCDEYDLYNPKEFKTYVDHVEDSVRKSMEYEEFIMYLRNYMDMNRCALFQNVNNIETTKIKIEIHHHPYTLHDIVLTIYNKRCNYGESLERELVAKEAMYIHYFLYVGLIPLAKTTHEMVHNNVLFIPLNIVLGKYEEFRKQYEEFIPPEVKDKIASYETLTKTYNSEMNRRVLEVAPVYLKIDGGDIGTYKLPKLQEVLNIMSKQLDEIEDRSPKGILIDPYYMDPKENESTKIRDEKGMIKPFIILKDAV